MPEYVYALHNFVPEKPDEVPFKVGDRIEVIEKDDLYQDGWWQVSISPSSLPCLRKSTLSCTGDGVFRLSNQLGTPTLGNSDNHRERSLIVLHGDTDPTIFIPVDLDNDRLLLFVIQLVNLVKLPRMRIRRV